jgi:hypothetical protein
MKSECQAMTNGLKIPPILTLCSGPLKGSLWWIGNCSRLFVFQIIPFIPFRSTGATHRSTKPPFQTGAKREPEL